MTLAERTDQMIKAGAAIQVRTGPHNLTTMLLAAARWDTGPKRLRWCAVYPEDQHHIHQTEYARTGVEYDRDILLYGKDDNIIASIVPLAEQNDIVDGPATLAAWQAALALPHNAREFEDFFNQD